MKSRVTLLLTLTLLVMSLVPAVGALVFVTSAFRSQEDVYKSAELNRVLQAHQDHLRLLSKLDNTNEKQYRASFEEIQDLKLIYGEDSYFSDRLKATLAKYFAFGFGSALILSLLAASALARWIHQIYKRSYDELQVQQNRARHLNEIARWQEVAKKLAHEFRRPLQPITSWVGNLKTMLPVNGARSSELLQEACAAIDEELEQLKIMVDEFATFANLPKAYLEPVQIADFLEDYRRKYAGVWERLNLQISNESELPVSESVVCQIDPSLFRQALNSMVENALEANPRGTIDFKISMITSKNQLILEIPNSGSLISESLRPHIFDLYVSTKHGKQNRGLGLAVVKMTVLEHGGEIRCLPSKTGARFQIQLPFSLREMHSTPREV